MVLEKRKLIVKDLYEESLFLLFIREILISNKDLKTWNKILSYNTINRFSDEEIKFFLKKLKEKGYIKSKNDFNYTYVPDDDFYFLLEVSEKLLEDYKNNKEKFVIKVSDSEMEIMPGIGLRSDYDIRWTLKWSLLTNEIQELKVFNTIFDLKNDDYISNIKLNSILIDESILYETEFIIRLLDLESNKRIKILDLSYNKKNYTIDILVKIIDLARDLKKFSYNKKTKTLTDGKNEIKALLLKETKEELDAFIIFLTFLDLKVTEISIESLNLWFKQTKEKYRLKARVKVINNNEFIKYLKRAKWFFKWLWFNIEIDEKNKKCSLVSV